MRELTKLHRTRRSYIFQIIVVNKCKYETGGRNLKKTSEENRKKSEENNETK